MGLECLTLHMGKANMLLSHTYAAVVLSMQTPVGTGVSVAPSSSLS